MILIDMLQPFSFWTTVLILVLAVIVGFFIPIVVRFLRRGKRRQALREKAERVVSDSRVAAMRAGQYREIRKDEHLGRWNDDPYGQPIKRMSRPTESRRERAQVPPGVGPRPSAPPPPPRPPYAGHVPPRPLPPPAPWRPPVPREEFEASVRRRQDDMGVVPMPVFINAPAPDPEPSAPAPRFESGGGGDFSGAGVTSSWDSSSDSSSSYSSDSSSSSSDSSSSDSSSSSSSSD